MTLSSTQDREHLPIPALRAHVRVLWELSGPCDDPAPQRMIPDGSMSLSINFGAPLTWVPGGGHDVPRGGTLFLGELRRPFEIASSGALDVVGVSFWGGPRPHPRRRAAARARRSAGRRSTARRQALA